ncbi:MAG: hypothetical protein ACHQWU_15965, partial [Gemmatimonadales bacterium]
RAPRRRPADLPHEVATPQGELMRAALRRSALMLVCVVAAPLSAQTLAANTQPESPAWMATSPRLTSDSTARPTTDGAPATPSPLVATRSGVHRPDLARPDHPTVFPSHADLGQARAMMIVGAAALFAGAIIGDTPGTIIMVGGAVIGLVGLYDYLQ